MPAPADLGIEVLSVPEGAPVELDLRLEAVMEGVLVTGTASAVLEGECARCLEPIHDELEVTFQELFVYDDIRDSAEAEEDDEVSMLQDDLVDLEPLLRDAVVLALPFQPLCQDDCPGLCPPECGGATHRRAGPRARGADRPAVGGTDQARARPHRLTSARPRAHPNQGEDSGCSEAEDVAQQHASPSFAVEGCRPRRW